MKKQTDLSNSFIELFAGGGGNLLGVLQAGWKCLAAVEWATDAAATLIFNLCDKKTVFHYPPEKQKGLDKAGCFKGFNDKIDLPRIGHLYCEDINRLTPEQVMKDTSIQPRQLGMICGGPPCQGFSVAGHRIIEDPRNQLLFRFLYFIKVMQPAVFKMENVPGILSLGKEKKDKEGPFVIQLREAAEQAGYVLEYKMLNAMNFGVPQTRKRIFFQGIRKDLYERGVRHSWPQPTHTWNFHDTLEKEGWLGMAPYLCRGEQPYVTVYEAIADLGAWHLSSSYDADCKDKPDGHPDRRSIGETKKARDRDGITAEIREDGYVYYKDRFSGNWFKGNHMADWGEGFKSYYYHRQCRYCGAPNIIVRNQCQRCHEDLFPYFDLSDLIL